MNEPTVRVEIRCGASTGANRNCGMLLGTADDSKYGRQMLQYESDHLGATTAYTGDIKYEAEFDCPKHGPDLIATEGLRHLKPRRKPYVVTTFRD